MRDLPRDLPLDPHDCPGTPEYQSLLEERAQRAYYAQLSAMEELMEINSLRRTSFSRWLLAPYMGAFFIYVLWIYSMTTTTPGKAAPSFPPVDDAITYIKSINWSDVRQRCRKGLNNVGLVVAVIGEKIHDVGSWMAQLWTLSALYGRFFHLCSF